MLLPVKDGPTRSFIKETLEEHKELLAREQAAGLPLGTITSADQIPPMPLSHNRAYEDAVARQNAPDPTRKRRFTRNSEHFAGRMVEIMETMGLRDPLLVLMEMATGKEVVIDGTNPDGTPHYKLIEISKLDPKTRVFAASEILSYVYPKRKSVEVSGAEGQPISFVVTADTSEIPQMPSDEELARMSAERRQQAAENERTINAIR